MKLLKAVAAALALSGCAGGPAIVSTVNEITGHRVDRMSENRIGPVPCGLTRDPCVFLHAERIVVGQEDARYRLAAVYEGEEWLFIQAGNTLEFELTQGLGSFSLFGQGSKEHRKILESKKLRETAYYEISANNLRRLAQSEKVRMKLHGDGFYVERSFSSANRRNFQAFAQKFLGK